jgi:chemotaxis protein MotB
MPRRNRHPGHPNHERWLISYADFITLMFAFFVVMFASSQADKGRAEQVSESIKKALEDHRFASSMANILGGAAGKKERGNAQLKGPGGTIRRTDPATAPPTLQQSLEVLKHSLRAEIESGMLQVSLEARGLVVSLRQAAFFPSGEDTIAPDTYPAIEKVADVVKLLPNKIRLEGHTDSIPIHNGRFRSNWELSSARAVAMIELFRQRFGVDESRLSAGGYADTIPLDTNETPEGRAHNRRVDIVILTELGTASDPKAAGGQPGAMMKK